MDLITKRDVFDLRAMHLLFKNKLRAYVLDLKPVPEAVLSDPEICLMGKWINHTGKARYGRFESFHELDIIHRKNHEKAREIIRLKKEGSLTQALDLFAEIEAIGKELMECIGKLAAEVENNSASMDPK